MSYRGKLKWWQELLILAIFAWASVLLYAGADLIFFGSVHW